MTPSPLVFIDGDQGTTGLQIHERLRGRTDLQLLTLPDAERKNPSRRAEAINSCDIAVLCLPDAPAREAAASIVNPSVRVIDASSAHRTDPQWCMASRRWAPSSPRALPAPEGSATRGATPRAPLPCCVPWSRRASCQPTSPSPSMQCPGTRAADAPAWTSTKARTPPTPPPSSSTAWRWSTSTRRKSPCTPGCRSVRSFAGLWLLPPGDRAHHRAPPAPVAHWHKRGAGSHMPRPALPRGSPCRDHGMGPSAGNPAPRPAGPQRHQPAAPGRFQQRTPWPGAADRRVRQPGQRSVGSSGAEPRPDAGKRMRACR